MAPAVFEAWGYGVVRRRFAAGALAVMAAALLPSTAADADDGWPAGVSPDAFHVATVGPASVTAGKNHSCAISTLGSLYCWGDNADGQLGDGHLPADSAVAVPVAHAPGVLDPDHPAVQVDAGAAHTCAIDINGTAYCWGANSSGQLGIGSTVAQGEPAPVDRLTDRTLVEITTGADHSCAIDDEGAAWCWGDNSAGQLGVPAGTPRSSRPVRVSTATGMTGPVVDIAAGGNSTCAVTDAGAAYCWGEGGAGQIGDGHGVDRDEPTPVSTAGVTTRFRQITVGDAQACTVDAAGHAWCWGDTAGGTSGTPARVDAPGVEFAELSGGARHVCGLARTSVAYCWGSGVNGQLGDGSTTHADAPARVDTNGVPLHDIAAGARHTCALDSSGVTYCWGADDEGQLGNGSAAASIVPAVVSGVSRPPAAVTGVRATPIDGGLRVTWRPAAAFGTGTFTAYAVQTSAGAAHCVATTAAATGCDVLGLANGTGYDVQVLTVTTAGQALSEVVSGTPAAPPKTAPAVPPTLAPGGDGGLPVTGANPVLLVAAGFLLVGLGLAALLVRRPH